MKVSILIPVYNEIHLLSEVLDRVFAAPLPPGCGSEADLPGAVPIYSSPHTAVFQLW